MNKNVTKEDILLRKIKHIFCLGSNDKKEKKTEIDMIRRKLYKFSCLYKQKIMRLDLERSLFSDQIYILDQFKY